MNSPILNPKNKINEQSKTIPFTDPEHKKAESPEVDITYDKPTKQATTNKVPQQREKKENKEKNAGSPPQILAEENEQRSGSTSKRKRSANTSTESLANTRNDLKAEEIENDD